MNHRGATFLLAVAVTLLSTAAEAATRVWTGAAGIEWSKPGNWQGGVVPVAGDRLVFSNTTGVVDSYNDLFNVAFEALEIRSNGQYVFRGEPIPLSASTGSSLFIESASPLISFKTTLRLTGMTSRITVRPVGGEAANLFFSPIVALGPLIVDAGNANIDFDDILPYTAQGFDLTAGVVRMPGTNAFQRDVFITARSVVAGPNALGLQTAITYMRAGSGMLQTTGPRVGTQRYDLRGTGPDAGMSLHDGIVTELYVEGTQKIEALGTLQLLGPIFGPGRIVLDGTEDSTTLFSRNMENTFAGGVELRNGRLDFTGPNALPESADLVINGPTSVVGAGAFTQVVRKFICNGGVVDWTPTATTIEATDGLVLNGCKLRITYTPGTVPDLDELTILRNDTTTPPAEFEGFPAGRHLIIDGIERVVSYRLGGSRSDVLLVKASTRGKIQSSSPPKISLPIDGVIANPLSVRSVNVEGVARPNSTLLATVAPAHCGTFPGGVEMVELTTDGDGRASAPAFTAAGYNVVCTLTVGTVGGDASASVDIVVYEPASLRVVFDSPYAVAQTGVPAKYRARVTAGGPDGVGVPGIPFAWEIRSTSAASAGPITSLIGNTDAQGYAMLETVPSGSVGSYRIALQTPTREASIAVTQGFTIANRTRADPAASDNFVTVMDGGGDCRLSALGFESKLPAPLRGFTFPRGFMRISATGCTGSTVHFRSSDAERPLRRNGVFMRYGPTADNTQPHWHVLAGAPEADLSAFNFALVDGVQDDDLAANGSLSAFVAFAVPADDYQDMWWAGSVENGWGMSVVQHRDTLFNVIYAYDNAGKPTWYVMPGGSWDAAHRVYSGPVYTPRGSPFFAYNTSALVVGAPVGNVTLRFIDSGHATLEYTINGVSASKSMTRQSFGDSKAYSAIRGDMYWGGDAQNGWGIASIAQGPKLFSVWFTYDAAGAATWFVMPNGGFTLGDRRFEGRLLRTMGSPWLGAPYNAAALQVIDIGAFRFDFSGDTARFLYSNDGHGGTIELLRQPF